MGDYGRLPEGIRGGDRGIHFYESNVRDAIYALKACEPAMQS